MGNVWTNEEIEYLKEHYRSESDEEISLVLINHSVSSVATKRKRLGYTKTNKKYCFDDVVNEINKRGYILLSTEDEYINALSPIRYICKSHKDYGEQITCLGHLLEGKGCMYCGRERTIASETLNLEDTKYLDEQLCNSKGFEYIDTIRRDGKIYIRFICPKHRSAGVQEMTRGNMNRDNITGCKYCFDNKKFKFSKGEKKIEAYLSENNIEYIEQMTFDGCRDKCLLPFDFYLPDYNICIEYDGQHHFYPVTFNGVTRDKAMKNYKRTLKHDHMKNRYCIDNNIELIRIPYFEFNNIESILNKQII